MGEVENIAYFASLQIHAVNPISEFPHQSHPHSGRNNCNARTLPAVALRAGVFLTYCCDARFTPTSMSKRARTPRCVSVSLLRQPFREARDDAEASDRDLRVAMFRV